MTQRQEDCNGFSSEEWTGGNGHVPGIARPRSSMLKLAKSTNDPKILWQRSGLLCGYDNPERNQSKSTPRDNARAHSDSEARNKVVEKSTTSQAVSDR